MRRIIELDAVRGIAAVAILIFHADSRLLPQGWLAVDLFMLLSGYLITNIVLAHGRTEGFLRRFYLRRGLRTWPIYYLALAAVFLLSAWLGQPGVESLPYYLTFTQNLPYYWSSAVPPFPYHFFHTWSLAVEEQYYVVWPVVLLLVARRWIVPLSVSVVLLCAGARGAGAHWTLLIARCDGFALGGILALLFEEPAVLARHRGRLLWGFGVLGSSALAAAVWYWAEAVDTTASPVLKSAWMLAMNVSFFAGLGIVLVQAGNPLLRSLRSAILCGAGRISYGLYLYHPIVYVAVDRVASACGLGPSPGLTLAKLGLTVGLAVLSWRFVERPILALKDRWPYGPMAVEPNVEPVRPTGPWATSPA